MTEKILFIILLGALLAGCRASSVPTVAPTITPTFARTATALPRPTFAPTETMTAPHASGKNYPNITPDFIPSPTPPAVIYTTQDTLREFPLTLGATWVYSSTNYETLEGGALVTATFRVTDTVGGVETRNSLYAARIARSTSLAHSTRDLSQAPHGESYFFNMQNPQARWLSVDGNKIYEQWELDWANLELAPLEYIFPLHQGNRWYPDPEQRTIFSPYRSGFYGVPGLRVIPWQGVYTVPAGGFENCFEIHEIYNSGDSVEWFCSGIGIVAEQSDHSGTRFGFRQELVHFVP